MDSAEVRDLTPNYANFWCLAMLIIISDVCGVMCSIYVNSQNSLQNNSGFSVVTTCSLA